MIYIRLSYNPSGLYINFLCIMSLSGEQVNDIYGRYFHIVVPVMFLQENVTPKWIVERKEEKPQVVSDESNPLLISVLAW